MHWDERLVARLKLRDLHILAAVVEAGSMGRASETLHVSQPAVSKAIANLEHTLGVRLLDRTAQGVEPTSYGRALLKCGVALFDELRQGVKAIESLSDPSCGELRTGSTPQIATTIFLAVIERLTREHPRLAFHVVTAATETLLHELSERRVDVVMTRIFQPLAEQELEVEILFEDSFVVVAAPQNPWLRRRKVELHDLVNERWTLSPAERMGGSLVVEAFRACGLEPPQAAVVTHSLEMRKSLLATGRYLSVLPGFMLRFPSRESSFKPLAVDLPTTRRPIALITLKNRTLAPAARLFIDQVRALTRGLATSK